MLIQAFGLFWRADEVDWHPGSGGRALDGAPRAALLGHRGLLPPGIRVADFWDQRGIYILHGNYGPHYVGITTDRALGVRLREHLADRHKREWDRFSWFGFRRVLSARNEVGLSELDALHIGKRVEQGVMIREYEALLIHAMGLRNISRTRFPDAHDGEWKQVLRLEREILLPRLKPGRYVQQTRSRHGQGASYRR